MSGLRAARGTLAAAALREAVEESGIEGLAIDPDPLHLDVHLITCSLGLPTRHLDVRFLLRTPAGRERGSATNRVLGSLAGGAEERSTCCPASSRCGSRLGPALVAAGRATDRDRHHAGVGRTGALTYVGPIGRAVCCHNSATDSRLFCGICVKILSNRVAQNKSIKTNIARWRVVSAAMG